MGVNTEIEIDDGLTDEERAAIASDDDLIDTDTEEATDDDAAGSEAQDDEAGDSASDDGAAGGDFPADDAAKSSDDADDSADDAGQPAGPTHESAPILVAQPPEGADERLKEIAAQKEALLTQFDDGDITAKEYQLQLDSLAKEERKIEFDLHKAQLAAEMEQQRQANEWRATVEGFIAENPRYNPNTSPRMYQMLDMEVRAVATSDEFKNRTDSAAGRLILQRAHENLAKELGFEVKAKSKKAQAKAESAPPSLHAIPAADTNDVASGKFAVLDRLATTDPLAYEEQLMKLSDRERDAYLSA